MRSGSLGWTAAVAAVWLAVACGGSDASEPIDDAGTDAASHKDAGPSFDGNLTDAGERDATPPRGSIGQNDDVADGAQPYAVVFGKMRSTDVAFDGLDPDDVPLLNEDDDSPGVVVSAPAPDNVTTEAGGTVTFTVRSMTVIAATPSSSVRPRALHPCTTASTPPTSRSRTSTTTRQRSW